MDYTVPMLIVDMFLLIFAWSCWNSDGTLNKIIRAGLAVAILATFFVLMVASGYVVKVGS